MSIQSARLDGGAHACRLREVRGSRELSVAEGALRVALRSGALTRLDATCPGERACTQCTSRASSKARDAKPACELLRVRDTARAPCRRQQGTVRAGVLRPLAAVRAKCGHSSANGYETVVHARATVRQHARECTLRACRQS